MSGAVKEGAGSQFQIARGEIAIRLLILVEQSSLFDFMIFALPPSDFEKTTIGNSVKAVVAKDASKVVMLLGVLLADIHQIPDATRKTAFADIDDSI
jgi:hypothetical protein